MSDKYLQGGKLAGGNPENGRVAFDFYATNPLAVDMLFEKYPLKGKRILEPCVGMGHIADEIKKLIPDVQLTCVDIVDRGYENTIVKNFVMYDTDEKFDAVISNPPYSLAEEFVRKSINLTKEGGQVCMFLKIQFLEGAKRKLFYEQYPPKYIYVFRNRMSTWNNGNSTDADGKKWSTTMCHAWFVWEVGSFSEPVIRWL